MPSAVRVEGRGLTAFGNKFGFVVMDDDQAASGDLQLLDQFSIADACRMDMKGCSGTHECCLALW
ncbi:hypothetical protein BK661_10075 [Pseudomonas frederiksbergensis]|uniref:Uncharacterized protein n=1 Tax=Pseudomonas frederiksbergensis TaxID=104087 RepID=A0A423J9Q1_9PSED|nr:hypothetical protein BK661_10075 [Pseudomonas frederiksbergensis]